MTLRKISANYIYTGNGEVLINSILCTENDGTIVDIIKNQDFSYEKEGIEFYNGIICPGFINAFCNLKPSGLGQARQIEQLMFKTGIIAAGDISANTNQFFFKDEGFIFFKDISQSYKFKSSDFEGVYLINHNGISLKCIGSGIDSNNSKLSLKDIILNIINNYEEVLFGDLIQFLCLNGAVILGIEDWAGSLEKGKKPGINLINGLNPVSMKHSLSIIVKKLI